MSNVNKISKKKCLNDLCAMAPKNLKKIDLCKKVIQNIINNPNEKKFQSLTISKFKDPKKFGNYWSLFIDVLVLFGFKYNNNKSKLVCGVNNADVFIKLNELNNILHEIIKNKGYYNININNDDINPNSNNIDNIDTSIQENNNVSNAEESTIDVNNGGNDGISGNGVGIDGNGTNDDIKSDIVSGNGGNNDEIKKERIMDVFKNIENKSKDIQVKTSPNMQFVDQEMLMQLRKQKMKRDDKLYWNLNYECIDTMSDIFLSKINSKIGNIVDDMDDLL